MVQTRDMKFVLVLEKHKSPCILRRTAAKHALHATSNVQEISPSSGNVTRRSTDINIEFFGCHGRRLTTSNHKHIENGDQHKRNSDFQINKYK